MTVEYYDICKRPIGDSDFSGFSRYKLKKSWCTWLESGWEELVVHDECWDSLCREIRLKKEMKA